MRNFGGSITTYYLPVFFLKNYAGYKASYSLANALINTTLGLLSGIVGGIIADKYDEDVPSKKLARVLDQLYKQELIARLELRTSPKHARVSKAAWGELDKATTIFDKLIT